MPPQFPGASHPQPSHTGGAMPKIVYLYLGFLFLSLGYLGVTMTMNIGTPINPKAGFYPFIVALSMILSSGYLLLQSIRCKELVPRIGAFPSFRKGLKVVVFFILLTGYAFLLEPIGFTPVSFVFTCLLLYMLEWRNWGKIILTSALIAMVCDFIFWRLLDIPVPQGILTDFMWRIFYGLS
jgi:putative tricarboxylic transport membrane protein